jgi:hypothetical protein
LQASPTRLFASSTSPGLRRQGQEHLIAEKLGLHPREPLIRGLEKIYPWIAAQVATSRQRRGLFA